MPRLRHALPKYRLHRASGQAVVTVGGCDYYLGPFGSPGSFEARDRLVAQWLANGRTIPRSDAPAPALVVNELAAQYWRFAKGYYVKDDRPTNEQSVIKAALRRLCKAFGSLPAGELTPLALQELQQLMIVEDLARTYVNKQIQQMRRMYRWGVSQGLVPVTTHQALACVSGLKKGRTAARETGPVRPVPDEVVAQTLPHLPPVLADMVRFQRFVGCRPEEVWGLRPMDLECGGKVWFYTPASHKTDHHGHDRKIAVGPRAQAVIRPYLDRSPEAYCFSPAESEQQRLQLLRALRKSPVQPSQRNRRVSNPRRSAGVCYDTRSYNRAIDRACARAGIDKWAPNQLRHTAGTETRRKYGLEAAQAVLGQKRIEVTQIYAERRDDLAGIVAGEIG